MKFQDAQYIVASASNDHDPKAVFVMFSGGHDSLVATHITKSVLPASAEVVHIDTGIGIPETREFVQETCARHGWPLRVLTPPELTYEDIVLRYGFPGPAGHRYAYSWLKERALRNLVRSSKTKRSDRIMLVTGVRAQESQRRMGHVEAIQRSGSSVWVSPLTDWSAVDVTTYISELSLLRNPVVDLLHMSGECLCGAFAKPDELAEITLWYPDVGLRIKALEAQAECAGVHARWGTRPGKATGAQRLCNHCSVSGEENLPPT